MNYGRIDMKEFEQFRLFLVENDVLDRYIKYADKKKDQSFDWSELLGLPIA